MPEQFGTQELEHAIGLVAEISTSVDKKLDDGKLSFSEKLGLIGDATKLGYIATNYKLLAKQAADLSPEEKPKVVQRFMSKFDLRNDKAEEFVESVVSWLASFAHIVKLGGEIF